MNDLDKRLEKINNKIEELDKELNELQQRQLKREDEKPIGLISIVDNSIKVELLLNKNMFNEEDIKELTDITNRIQNLIVKVCEREDEDNE